MSDDFKAPFDSQDPINSLSVPGLPEVTPVTLPLDALDGEARPLEGPQGPYRMLAPEDQRESLMRRIGVLETEHFGLTREFSTVPHSGTVEEGETPDEAYRRFVAERLPAVESELQRLYAEIDALDEE